MDDYYREYFWPAVRARNFVKAMGGKPTKYTNNIEFLAKIASIEPSKMCALDPIKFANQYFPNKNNKHYIREQLVKMMGRGTCWDIEMTAERFEERNKLLEERKKTLDVVATPVAVPVAAPVAAPVAVPMPTTREDYAVLFDALCFKHKKMAYQLLMKNM